MSLNDTVAIPRRTMVLFFLIDTSGSMAGSKIGAVNTAVEEVIPALREVSDENADAQIKVGVLEFSSGTRWITAQGPVAVDQFRWNYLNAGGVTDFGAACKALHEKLSTKAFMQEATGSYAPAIFLISDGAPTDDWERGLALLKGNPWFKAGVKAAVAIGDDANKEVLQAFTGSQEAVLEVHNAGMLKAMIKFVSVRASQVASKSTSVSDSGLERGDEQKQEELNSTIQEFSEEAAKEPDNDQVDW